jgi:hypothetical protein
LLSLSKNISEQSPSVNMPKYRVVEPHPSINRPAIHTGRGGAGNVFSFRNTVTTPGDSAEGPASLAQLGAHPPKNFSSGRGGAGNIHSYSERAIFSFDEELERQMKREKEVAPVFHIGRGGAGNTIDSDGLDLAWKRRDGSVGSNSSNASTTDRVMQRARRSLEAGWEKLTGVN